MKAGMYGLFLEVLAKLLDLYLAFISFVAFSVDRHCGLLVQPINDSSCCEQSLVHPPSSKAPGFQISIEFVIHQIWWCLNRFVIPDLQPDGVHSLVLLQNAHVDSGYLADPWLWNKSPLDCAV